MAQGAPLHRQSATFYENPKAATDIFQSNGLSLHFLYIDVCQFHTICSLSPMLLALILDTVVLLVSHEMHSFQQNSYLSGILIFTRLTLPQARKKDVTDSWHLNKCYHNTIIMEPCTLGRPSSVQTSFPCRLLKPCKQGGFLQHQQMVSPSRPQFSLQNKKSSSFSSSMGKQKS